MFVFKFQYGRCYCFGIASVGVILFVVGCDSEFLFCCSRGLHDKLRS